MKTKKFKDWKTILKFLLILFIISWIASSFFSFDSRLNGNIAIIKINGEISSGEASFIGGGAISSIIIDQIKEVDSYQDIKAIIFDINSPGGSAVASSQIANQIKKVNKTTIGVISEIGASGAYWIASSTDKIFSNEMSIVGSIGVIGSYLEFSGLLEKYNVTYQRMVSGEFKDLGTPFKKLTFSEEEILQSLMDKIHKNFISAVAINRNLSLEEVENLATGLFFLGEEGINLGLIDEMGDIDSAIEYLEENLNITAKIITIKEDVSWGSLLSKIISKSSFYIGKGISSNLMNSISIKT